MVCSVTMPITAKKKKPTDRRNVLSTEKTLSSSALFSYFSSVAPRPHPAPLGSSGTEHRPAPGCLPGKSCRTGHRNDSHAQPSLLRVTPFAVSEHYSELIGCPISWSFATSRIDLELRPLSSAGITRLLQYYEPLRHPRAPGPSLTGVRLIFP